MIFQEPQWIQALHLNQFFISQTNFRSKSFFYLPKSLPRPMDNGISSYLEHHFSRPSCAF